MQRWEYLRVNLWRDAWTDSHGRQGTLSRPWAGTWKDFANSGQVSSEFGAEGWELTTSIGTAGNSFILFFERPAEG